MILSMMLISSGLGITLLAISIFHLMKGSQIRESPRVRIPVEPTMLLSIELAGIDVL